LKIIRIKGYQGNVKMKFKVGDKIVIKNSVESCGARFLVPKNKIATIESFDEINYTIQSEVYCYDSGTIIKKIRLFVTIKELEANAELYYKFSDGEEVWIDESFESYKGEFLIPKGQKTQVHRDSGGSWYLSGADNYCYTNKKLYKNGPYLRISSDELERCALSMVEYKLKYEKKEVATTLFEPFKVGRDYLGRILMYVDAVPQGARVWYDNERETYVEHKFKHGDIIRHKNIYAAIGECKVLSFNGDIEKDTYKISRTYELRRTDGLGPRKIYVGQSYVESMFTLISNPVFLNGRKEEFKGKGWYYWDETWSEAWGPYDTEEEANESCAQYGREL